MRCLWSISISLGMLLSVPACADFDRKFDQALFGSDENIQAANQNIAENKQRWEEKKREDLEEELFDRICQARKHRGLPCDRRNWDIQPQARAAAAEVTRYCADLPRQASPSAMRQATLGVLPQEGDGAALFICHTNNPRAVLHAWAADIRTHDIIWDAQMRTFGLAVHRSGNGAYSWVLLEK